MPQAVLPALCRHRLGIELRRLRETRLIGPTADLDNS